MGIQKSLKEMNWKIEDVKKVLASITKSLKEVPARTELREHPVQLEDQVAQIQEVNTGLTTAMEGCEISESSWFDFRQNTAQPGLSGTVHPQRRPYFDGSVSGLRDTDSPSTWHWRIPSGAGSNSSHPGEAARGAASGTAGGAASGAAGGNGDPPPDPPPSDHSIPNRRISQRQR